MINKSSSSKRSNSSNKSLVWRLNSQKTPSILAFCSPLLIILTDARSPSNKPIASISNDLPAPVSPVIAVNPL